MDVQTVQAVMVQSRIKAERVTEVQAATKKMVAALEWGQHQGVRYASCLLPDGETFLVLVQFDEGGEDPLAGLPEYQELFEIVEGSRAEPPSVQPLQVIGSYRLF